MVGLVVGAVVVDGGVSGDGVGGGADVPLRKYIIYIHNV